MLAALLQLARHSNTRNKLATPLLYAEKL